MTFEEDGGYVENIKTDEKIYMERIGGVYQLNVWVKNGGEEAEGEPAGQVFTGPGRR